MTNQYLLQTEPSYVYSGSMTDSEFYGNPLALSESFNRKKIFSKISGPINSSFSKKDILYSERMAIYSGSAGGSKTQNLFVQATNPIEQYYDSFCPSPYDIVKTNGTKFAYLNGSGSLSGSETYGIPADDTTRTVPLLLGTVLSRALDSEVVDTTWLKNPYPFSSRYKSLKRIFKPSYFLPEKVTMTKNYWSGDSVSIQSNEIGSLYFIGPSTVRNIQTTVLFTTKSSEVSEFKMASMPSPELYGAVYPITNINYYYNPDGDDVYFANGALYTAVMKSHNGVDWTKVLSQSIDMGLGYSGGSPVVPGFVYSDSDTKQFKCWTIPRSPVDITESGTHVVYNTDVFGSDNNWTKQKISEDTYASLGFCYAPRGITGSWCMLCVTASNIDSGAPVILFSSGSDPALPLEFTASLGQLDNFIFSNGTGLGHNLLTWEPSTQRFLCVGSSSLNGPGIWRSTTIDGSGSWSQITNITGSYTSEVLMGSCADPQGTGTVIAVGGKFGSEYPFFRDGIILRSADGGISWTIIDIDGNTSGFLGITKLSGSGNWLVCGSYGALSQSNDDGLTWSSVDYSQKSILSTSLNYNIFNVIGSIYEKRGSADTQVDLPNILALSNRSVEGEDWFFGSSNFIRYRITDAEISSTASNGDNFASKIEPNGFKNTSLLNENNFKTLRTNIKDMNKVFFGYGDGLYPDLSPFFNYFDWNQTGQVTPAPINLRKVGPGYQDISYVRHYGPYSTSDSDFDKSFFPGSPLESVRIYNPIIRGFRYGLINTNPTNLKAIFRRDHYGFVRDMLEQSPNAKTLITNNSNITTTTSPVVVTFVSGSTAFNRAKVYVTASNPDFNPWDSGIYDYEYKAGQPFYDDRAEMTGSLTV